MATVLLSDFWTREGWLWGSGDRKCKRYASTEARTEKPGTKEPSISVLQSFLALFEDSVLVCELLRDAGCSKSTVCINSCIVYISFDFQGPLCHKNV